MVEIVQGDITKLLVDAIVNAANTTLLGGGGVDGAIHRAGGSAILDECRKIGGCAVGQAVITTGGKLPAKFVIHTVGPIWRGGDRNEAQLLKNAYVNSLALASPNGVRTIAFPNISTGVYHFPKEAAAQIAIDAVNGYLASHADIERVVFVCFDSENFEIYQRLLAMEQRL